MFVRASVILLSWLSVSVYAVEPIRDHIEYTTSIADAYDSRSVFTNPAALGFQTELNGATPLSSFSAGLNRNKKDELSFALTYGVFGFGYERISTSATHFNRYGFSLGMPLPPYVFTGFRYTFTRSASANFNRFNSLDYGIQIRPSQYYSIGLLAETINQPRINGILMPTRFVAGIAIRPIRALMLTADVDTNSDNFGNNLGYEANLSAEVIRGLKIRGGYHKDHKWQVGVQLNFGINSFYSITRPETSNRSTLIGMQSALKPYPSPARFSTALEVSINGSIGEEPIYGGLFGTSKPSLLSVLRRLDEAKNRKEVKLVIVHIKRFPLGLAAAQDVTDALWDLRERGKKVDVYLENAGLKEYLIASAANSIHMEPSSELRLTGLREARYYLKGTLDKIGIEGELLAKGKYKSAPETFTRKGASNPSKEASLDRLRETQRVLLTQLKKSKRIDEAKWKKILNYGLFSPEDAKKWNLIDGIASFKESKEEYKVPVTKSLAYQRDDLALPKRVAVIVASGDIMQGGGGLLSLAGRSQVTFKKMEDRFKKAMSDPLTKAIVFRVSSPGGEILPSQQIASLVKKASKKKPVIVSMGDYAASGGYMISAPANTIFAQPSTQTGSIGVFLGKVNLSGLYKKIDLRKEVLTEAPYADLYSEHKGLSKQGRAILTRRLNQYYDGFVSYVAKHRKYKLVDAERVAQGRVWTGSQAAKNKLVDHTGSYLDAIAFAANKVGLKDYEYPIIRGPISLFSPFGESGWLKAQVKESFSLPWPTPELARQVHLATLLNRHPFLYLDTAGTIED